MASQQLYEAQRDQEKADKKAKQKLIKSNQKIQALIMRLFEASINVINDQIYYENKNSDIEKYLDKRCQIVI